MKGARFDVYVKGLLIDRVWFDKSMEAIEVRGVLINHDGYPPTISVYRNNERCTAYDSVAKHEEEL